MTWTERTCTENTSGFEWAFEVADSGFSEDVDGHGFGIVDILDAHEGLDEQGVCEVELQVHDTYHGDTQNEAGGGRSLVEQDKRRRIRTHELWCFWEVIVTDGGGH